MKRIILLTLAILFASVMFAQDKEITLTVFGDGANKQEATQIALRSAIEQAFGTFVSANTTILNDELIKDEIATVSSGNIKEYKELLSGPLPNGKTSVTLQATVSISKLISYAQSKGSSAEFAGATFGMNMKMKELNKQNEEKAIENMLKQLETLIPFMFDYELELGEPRIDVDDDSKYQIPAKIIIIYNDYVEQAKTILITTLSALSLKTKEIEEYENVRLSYNEAILSNHYISKSPFCGNNNYELVKFSIPLSPRNLEFYNYIRDPYFFYFRSNAGVELGEKLSEIFQKAVFHFKIETNVETSFLVNLYDYKSFNDVDDYGNDYKYYGYYGNGIIEIISFAMTGRDCVDDPMHLGPKNFIYSSTIRIDGCIILPHLFKDLLATYNGKLVPYILDAQFSIPKDDIMKYSKFSILKK